MKAKLSNYIALDLGSSKIASIASYIDRKGEIRILNQNLHYSEGFRSGMINNLEAAENSIINVIYALEKSCDKNIKEVGISLSGADTKSYFIQHKIKLSPSQQITQQDVKRLIQKALTEFKIKDQEVIHCFPLEFSIEDGNIIDNPVGMFGRELSCQLHLVTASTNLLTNLTNCLNKCHLGITDVMLAIYASGMACLSEDEKNLGSIIIDFGARTTSFGVFLSGKLAYAGFVPLGSWHITSDIAKVFSLSFNAAEKLKVLYGHAFISPAGRDNPINLEDVEPDNSYNMSMTITSNYLGAVINSRIEEILLMVKQEYDRIMIDHLIARKLVITGGGAMLRGLKELAGHIFEKQVRIGKPSILPGFAEDYNPGAYSTAVGMVKNHSLKQQKLSTETTPKDQNPSWFFKAFGWLKENI